MWVILKPADLAALAAALPDDAIVLTFDVETCAAPGGDARVPGKARVIQFGCVAFSAATFPDADPIHDEDGVCVGYTFSEDTHVNPTCRIDAGSQAVHRITDAQVRGAPTIAKSAPCG